MVTSYRAYLPRVRALYRKEPRWTRFKVWGRLRSIDYTWVLEELPAEGTLFDFGCGHGFFAALVHLRHPDLRIAGCDYSEEKIAVAHRCIPAEFPIELYLGSDLPSVPESVAAVTMLDVLHYVPFDRWEELFAQTWACLEPGGVFLLKEHDPGLRMKFLWNSFFETLTTRWNKVEKRSDLTFKPRTWFLEKLGGLGFQVDVVRLDRGSLFSHVLYVARKRKKAA